jgi:DNA-directed RNA polymerase, mitochondrial
LVAIVSLFRWLRPFMSTDSIKEGEKRYVKRTSNLRKKKKETRTLYGKRLYREYRDKFTEQLTREIEIKLSGKASLYAAEWGLLKELPLELISHLTLTGILDGISTQISRTGLALKLGSALEDEITFSELKKTHPKFWKTAEASKNKRSSYGFRRGLLIRLANQELGEGWKRDIPVTTKVHLGLSLLEIFRITTGLIEYTKRRLSKLKFESIVIPTKRTLEWIQGFNNHVKTLLPYYLPLSEVPKDWINTREGGYQLPESINWYFVKGNVKSKKVYDECSTLEIPFDAANTLQRVPFRINRWLLEFISVSLNQGLSLGEMRSHSDIPLGDPRYTIGYRQCQAQRHRQRIQDMPKVILTHNLTQIAKDFAELPSIYFPVQADFRGRLYYVPRLNPQGNDLAKGLLEFGNGSTVQGNEHWFLIGGANSYGIKGSMKERQEWALDNRKLIVEAAQEPWASRAFWEEAADPFPFLAWCREFGDWIDNRLTFQTRLPVKLDHTASGLQIVGLLHKDETLMKLTNLLEGSYPEDIYMEILKKLTTHLKASHKPEHHAWASLKPDRSLIKKLTVRYMYGATFHGLEKVVKEWYIENCEDIFGRKIYFEIGDLIRIYLKLLDEFAPVLKKFLQQVSQEQSQTLLSWEGQSGFPVINSYSTQTKTLVRTTIANERVCARVNSPLKKLNVRAARRALPANKVHAYDAAILHKVLAKDEWPDIIALHDCYGVPPRDCDRLQRKISIVLEDIFGLDLAPNLCYTAS